MHYDVETAKDLVRTQSNLRFKFYDLLLKSMAFSNGLTNERAREFFVHGICRRLWMLFRSIENVFRLFPVNSLVLLTQNDREDIQINLHAFLINIYGMLENIALALAYENDLVGDRPEGKLHQKQVNLFNRQFQQLIDPDLKLFLSAKNLDDWYKCYAKNYRDALAHRIPPYVPPAALNKEEMKRYKEIGAKMQEASNRWDYDRVSLYTAPHNFRSTHKTSMIGGQGWERQWRSRKKTMSSDGQQSGRPR
jgi:hypothetical protein